MNLLRELQSNEPTDKKSYLRMENHTFYEFRNLVRPYIEMQNTMMRENISAEERLVATLRFLAPDAVMRTLSFRMQYQSRLLERSFQKHVGQFTKF